MSDGGGGQEGLASRRAALAALTRIDEDEAWSTRVVPTAVQDLADPRDRAFASHLAYDTVRWTGTLDWALATACNRPLSQVEPALLRVLRLGALQIMHSSVPERAAVSTSVDLAREAVPRKRAKGAAGFVNGTLRGLLRNRPELPSVEDDPATHLALATGHPVWVVEELLQRMPVEAARSILDGDNQPPGLTLRAEDPDGLVAELRSEGIAAVRPGTAVDAVTAPGADPRQLAAVRDGRATPQDAASMRVGRAGRPRAGDRVLDLCAGPGGKATHLARLVGATGHVVAVELQPHRARQIEERAARLGVDLDVRVGDGRTPPVEDEQFDVVVVDAPCTGLGTGRRRPEVRWRREAADVPALAVLQQELLEAAAPLVAPGGRLVYAVCTWTRAETWGVVAAIDGATHRHGLRPDSAWQLWPHRDGTDGMFCSTWTRPE